MMNSAESRDRRNIGNYGEWWAYEQLMQRGYEPRIPAPHNLSCCDLKVHGLPIEVKYATAKIKPHNIKRRGQIIRTVQRLRFQWNVRQLKTDDRVVILIAAIERGFEKAFVCPSTIFLDRTIVEINSLPEHYKGYFSPYYELWETIDYLVEKRYKTAQELDICQYYQGGQA